MSAAASPDFSVRSILLANVVTALPALAMLAVIGIAAYSLDGWAETIAVVCAIGGMFAGDALFARTAVGAEQRSARERLIAVLDVTESRARSAALIGPIAIGFGIVVLTTDPNIAALAIGFVVGFALAQLAFATWLHGRRDALSHAPRA